MTKKFKNQSSVTCQYKATTNFKQLSTSNLIGMAKTKKDVITTGVATHVVTGILYGASAFFVFDSEKLDNSSVQSVQSSMEAVIKKIPSFMFEGKVKMNLNEKEKALTNTFSCKFHGDFILDHNPTTFADTVKTFIKLSKLPGKEGKNSVPMMVWLTPLKKLYSGAPELKSELSIGILWKVQDAFEDLK